MEAAVNGIVVACLYMPNGNPQPERRAAYERLLSQGWLDCLRHENPDEAIYTFWDYFRQHWPQNKGLRIDHISLNTELAPQLKAAGGLCSSPAF